MLLKGSGGVTVFVEGVIVGDEVPNGDAVNVDLHVGGLHVPTLDSFRGNAVPHLIGLCQAILIEVQNALAPESNFRDDERLLCFGKREGESLLLVNARVLDVDFRREQDALIHRVYRSVRPDASDLEVFLVSSLALTLNDYCLRRGTNVDPAEVAAALQRVALR